MTMRTLGAQASLVHICPVCRSPEFSREVIFDMRTGDILVEGACKHAWIVKQPLKVGGPVTFEILEPPGS